MVQLVVTVAHSGLNFSQEYLSLFHDSDLFDFYVFAMAHRRIREPLCEPNF